MTIIDIIIRTCLAMLIGGLIGWQRESTHRPAGLRTHMLVCVGAAIVMMTGERIFVTFAGMTNPDPARLGAQVIAGIGFLGAGTIMKEGFSIKGLTTAASLWVVAVLGLAAGAGSYIVAIGGATVIIVTLTVFENVEAHVNGGKRSRVYVELDCQDASKTLLQINKLVPEFGAELRDLDIIDEEFGGVDCFRITFKLYFLRKNLVDYPGVMLKLNNIPGISNLKMEEF